MPRCRGSNKALIHFNLRLLANQTALAAIPLKLVADNRNAVCSDHMNPEAEPISQRMTTYHNLSHHVTRILQQVLLPRRRRSKQSSDVRRPKAACRSSGGGGRGLSGDVLAATGEGHHRGEYRSPPTPRVSGSHKVKRYNAPPAITLTSHKIICHR